MKDEAKECNKTMKWVFKVDHHTVSYFWILCIDSYDMLRLFVNLHLLVQPRLINKDLQDVPEPLNALHQDSVSHVKTVRMFTCNQT